MQIEHLRERRREFAQALDFERNGPYSPLKNPARERKLAAAINACDQAIFKLRQERLF